MSKFPGDNSRAIATHQVDNRREIQRLLLQALKSNTRGDDEAANQLILEAMESNEIGAEIDRLQKEASLDNGNIQVALGLISQKILKLLARTGS
jgi:hypothetical protein